MSYSFTEDRCRESEKPSGNKVKTSGGWREFIKYAEDSSETNWLKEEQEDLCEGCTYCGSVETLAYGC